MLDNYTGKYTGAGQTIVIIDSGSSANYTNSNVVYSYDFADNDSNASNTGSNHGGQVANVAQQVASGVKIIHLKVFSDGADEAYASTIEKALQWVVTNTDTYNITAVNLSLGSGNVQTPKAWSGADEYQTLDDKGVIVTVASGNSGQNYPEDGVNYLSSSENVISVSAANNQGSFTSFSQQHEDLTDVVALGKDITVIDNNNILHSFSGTSFSAPIIAATAAVVQEAAMDLLGHKLTDEEFLDLIQKTGDKVTNYIINNGTTSTTSNGIDLPESITTLSGGASQGSNTDVEPTPQEQVIIPETDPGGYYGSPAYELPKFTANKVVIKDSLLASAGDNYDYYHFTLDGQKTISMDLVGDSEFSYMLLDKNHNEIASKGGFWWNSNDDFQNLNLDKGEYFIQVTNYQMYDNFNKAHDYEVILNIANASDALSPDVSLAPAPTSDTDDSSIATAQNLGTLDVGTKKISNSIDKITDNKDFFQFELTQPGKVNFLLSELSADVDLNLYDANGYIVHSGWDWGSVDIAYAKELVAGTYYVEVDYYDGDGVSYDNGVNKASSSSYDLSLTLSDISTPEGIGDGSIVTAQNLGALSAGTKIINDSLDKETDNQDFFQFELTQSGKVHFSLSNLASDIDLNLYDSNGNTVHKGWDWGNVDIDYSKELSAGTYYVEVDYYDGANLAKNSSYDLSLTLGDVEPPTHDAGTPIGYTNINLANAISYLETHQNEYDDMINPATVI